jgi:hypothetical protein
MAERDMRRKVCKILKPLSAFAVENSCKPGTPDVNYINGWIELKWARKWPVRPTTPLRLPHYSPQQKNFGEYYWKNGGRAWLLLQVRREWFLFTGPVAAEIVGTSTRSELFDHATRHWSNGVNQKDLIECLTMDWESLNS